MATQSNLRKIALVHDQLFEFGGAERVLVSLKKAYPDADVFVAGYDKKVAHTWIKDFDSWNIKESWVVKIPFYRTLYSPLRFLIPFIWESMDFSDYDLVISSSSWFMSKGIITKPHTKHISYIHHPPAALYYYQSAVEWQKYFLIKIYAVVVGHFLRMWDYIGSQRPDILVANSYETAGRLKKFYGRDSDVVYPPVKIPAKYSKKYSFENPYYITLSRLAFKKHVDFLIRAANQFGFYLKVVGTGRDEEELRKLAGPTVEILGYVPDEDFNALFENARGFLFASEDEEFGIAPVEAMGRGVPVIAFASGGLIETVKEGKNGYLYDVLDSEKLHEKIQKLEQLSKTQYEAMSKAARRESEKYTEQKFLEGIEKLTKKL